MYKLHVHPRISRDGKGLDKRRVEPLIRDAVAVKNDRVAVFQEEFLGGRKGDKRQQQRQAFRQEHTPAILLLRSDKSAARQTAGRSGRRKAVARNVSRKRCPSCRDPDSGHIRTSPEGFRYRTPPVRPCRSYPRPWRSCAWSCRPYPARTAGNAN